MIPHLAALVKLGARVPTRADVHCPLTPPGRRPRTGVPILISSRTMDVIPAWLLVVIAAVGEALLVVLVVWRLRAGRLRRRSNTAQGQDTGGSSAIEETLAGLLPTPAGPLRRRGASALVVSRPLDIPTPGPRGQLQLSSPLAPRATARRGRADDAGRGSAVRASAPVELAPLAAGDRGGVRGGVGVRVLCLHDQTAAPSWKKEGSESATVS